jgi:hypothetical protein
LQVRSGNLNHIFWSCCLFLLALFFLRPLQAQEKESSYSISLVKTAEMEEDMYVYDVDDKKVLGEEYIIQEKDHIWKILRRKGLLKRKNLSELLSTLKKLNPSLGNLDLVHPGEKIIIPLKIAPVEGAPASGAPAKEEMVPVTALKDLDFESYTVRPGDSLIRVIKGRYTIAPRELYSEYFRLVKKLNPSIKDLDSIYPGQIIKLPVYSPEIVRRPIKKPIVPESKAIGEEEKEKQEINPMARDLGIIFSEIGEEWVQTGDHFIPLKSGGQIDLKARSFPVINLQNGLRVIVDLHNRLPDEMANLVISSWENYRVVHILEGDDLRSSLDKILGVCNYPKVFKKGEPIELEGKIHFKITGDWIIKLSQNGLDNRPGTIVINLTDDRAQGTPHVIREYLEGFGVNVIDYPSYDDDKFDKRKEGEILVGDNDPASIVKTVLDLTDQFFSTQVGIPVYQSQSSDLKFIINADFLLNIDGRDAIIDLTGLAPDTISFLKEHRFSVLSLASEKEPFAIVARTLELLNVQFDPGPHSILVANRDDSRNIRLTLPGIVFPDSQGEPVLVTPLSLPDKITAFLSQRGYRILNLPVS